MTGVRAADSAETLRWSASRAERIRSQLRRFGRSDAWLGHQVDRKMRVHPNVPVEAHIIIDNGIDVGIVAIALAPAPSGRTGSIIDIWIDPDHRGRGLGTFARLWAQDWAAARAGSLFAAIDPKDPAQVALFASYPVRAQTMMKALEPPAALPDDVEGRPMTEAEYAVWHEETVHGYAESISGSGLMSFDDALIRSRTQTDELLSLGLRTPDHTFWSVHAGPRQVATNWLRHRYEPETSFVFGVKSDPAYRGKGYGRAAMSVGEQAALDAGDTHLALNVFGQNQVAINLYTAMGYAVVEQNRSVNF